jgi:D-sedoheptulose 7-phosphate isomerase
MAPHLAAIRPLPDNRPRMDVDAIRRIAADSLALKQRFFETSAPLLLDAGQRLSACLKAGGKVLTFGNGGSAADAQHLAGELVGRFRRDRAGLPALALTTDPSIITAVGNDLGYDQVFRRQVDAHGRKGDAAVGISTSGRSPNVVLALALARERGLLTLGLTGGGGGRLAGLVDVLIDVPSQDVPRIQEVHTMVVHILCEIVEEAVAG